METKISLHKRMSSLAEAPEQVRVLEKTDCGIERFQSKLAGTGDAPLCAEAITVLQVNTGYRCNLFCRHCHVDAAPDRKEMMSRETMRDCLEAISKSSAIRTLDITGGAPEMNPELPWFIREARKRMPDGDIFVRTNLVILVSGEKYSHFPELFRENRVKLIASLPCYTQENVDAQRGEGVFHRSIEALKTLNAIGYGKEGSGLEMNLVYNPGGPSLPGEQQALEVDYKNRLLETFGIDFSHLYTITNMPISRFLETLLDEGRFCEYMNLLVENFSPQAVKNLMCRSTVSVGWDGVLYDCDFNQMLQTSLLSPSPGHISEFDEKLLRRRKIAVGQHCYGCSAGAGSSCQGSLL
ncbi:MAG: arsenosugar biosynthesis radical SAM protein ArsS [Chlorobium phaeobacteroides]|uniref:Radical SAM domain protein n=1 Tax=Chlorobium phaeobacteroides (strain BS1) TaxID=331678 RepID=B3EJY8_CHLPB|nr:arsenosugar biosynthesis radical SAM protein ArsS [Chlorobium phaeobacteroides]MBL6956134.1 arsenosugar biosynthesis radical SAM protein ArsS [Chlorobium phaeobacteroides]